MVIINPFLWPSPNIMGHPVFFIPFPPQCGHTTRVASYFPQDISTLK
jgi:hypothetical protein